jgi:hypothetical protein
MGMSPFRQSLRNFLNDNSGMNQIDFQLHPLKPIVSCSFFPSGAAQSTEGDWTILKGRQAMRQRG